MIASMFIDCILILESCLSINLALNSEVPKHMIYLSLWTAIFVLLMLIFRLSMFFYLSLKDFNDLSVQQNRKCNLH